MAVRFHEHKDEEQRMLVRLLKHFDWEQNECFPNVMLFAWESDLLVLSQSRYVTEVEVKVSYNDWKIDHQKDKFKPKSGFQDRVKRFYYAVPAEVYARHLEQPVVVHQNAGILVYGLKDIPRLVEVQQPKNFPAKPVSEAEHRRLQRSLYFRFHRQFIKGIPKPVVQSQPYKNSW